MLSQAVMETRRSNPFKQVKRSEGMKSSLAYRAGRTCAGLWP